ncbi:MAG: NUDIX domain-containing protein [Clostridia bacterium]|nr:NUDIX domain-containing protein [Clostridia bacterium]
MEKVDIYNRFREKTGKTKYRNELEVGEYRISTHIWLFNYDGKLLVQKRSLKEDKFPGFWAQTGGGVKAGMTSMETVFEECKEELNVEVDEQNLFYVASYTREKDIVDVWVVKQRIDLTKITLQADEVEEVRLVTFDEFDSMIEQGIVVPSINPSYSLVKNYLLVYNN